MSQRRNRQRLIHSLIYFSENTVNTGKLKLFKLLYALDFAHFKEIGRSVTGLDYSAWEKGPVPTDLYKEWQTPKLDFNRALSKHTVKFDNGMQKETLRPKVNFDPLFFSDYQLSLLKQLSKTYFRYYSDAMTKDSHAEFGCWDYVYNVLGMPSGQIDYDLILKRQDSERDKAVREIAAEYSAVLENHEI